jgi:hypothetical protein
MTMVEEIFTALPQNFRTGKVPIAATYYFSIDQVKKTVTLTPDSCTVEDGKTVASADCVCKMPPELFLKVWHDGYVPGLRDFLSGAIKSNDPQKLLGFLQAFGKS